MNIRPKSLLPMINTLLSDEVDETEWWAPVVKDVLKGCRAELMRLNGIVASSSAPNAILTTTQYDADVMSEYK
jgi:hypothetical protein